MGYVKYGVVTKIDILSNSMKAFKYVDDNFDLTMFYNVDNSYFLDEKFLNRYIWKFREEVLDYCNNSGDSFSNCDAYCLEVSIKKLCGSKIILCSSNEKYYFLSYPFLHFDTDEIVLNFNGIMIKIFFIPVFWDINKICCDDFNNVMVFINRLFKTALQCPLKDASIFTIV